MKFYLYDSIRNGDAFDHVMKAATEEEAFAEASAEWETLSAHDKDRRDAFFFGKVPEEVYAAYRDGEDVDVLDHMTDIVSFK